MSEGIVRHMAGAPEPEMLSVSETTERTTRADDLLMSHTLVITTNSGVLRIDRVLNAEAEQ